MKKSATLKIPTKSKANELTEWQNKIKKLPWRPATNQRISVGTRFNKSGYGFDKQKIHETLQERKSNYGFGKYVLNTKRLGTWKDLGQKITNTVIGDKNSKTRRYKKQQKK